MQTFKTSPTLQNVTSKGLSKFWYVSILEDNGKYYLSQTHWQLKQDGTESVRQSSEPREVYIKNIGKTNETTLEYQAIFEFSSTIERYKDKGYVEPGCLAKVEVLPMLAQSYSESKFNKLDLAYASAKIDGIRMLVNRGVGYTRSGKPIMTTVIDHILAEINDLPETIYIDGELVLPLEFSFQDTIKAIKKYRPETSPLLKFIVFDYYDSDAPQTTFTNRLNNLQRIFNDSLAKDIVLGLDLNRNQPIVLLDTKIVTEPTAVPVLLQETLAQGYEGLILRSGASIYTPGQRSANLLKLKEFEDAEFLITDVVQGEGSYVGCAIFVCVTAAGLAFNVNPKGSISQKKEMYANRLNTIGKQLTVRYQNLSDELKPRFPVGLSVRDIDLQG